MERPADDIFLINDLAVLQSPVSRHLFLGRSSDHAPTTGLGTGPPGTTPNNNHTASKPLFSNTADENKQQNGEVPVKRKRGRPPKNKSVAPVAPTAAVPPVGEPRGVEPQMGEPNKAEPKVPTPDIQPQTQPSGNPKVITLADWSLATVPNSAKLTGVPTDVRQLWVVLVGRRHDMVEAWHSSIVTERILANHIKTGSGRSLYILEAPMNTAEMQANGFSDAFIGAFRNGFPENWRALLMAELERLGKGVGKPPLAPGPDAGPQAHAPTDDKQPQPVKRRPGRPKKTPEAAQERPAKGKTPTIEELIESKIESKRRQLPPSSPLGLTVEEQMHDLVNESLAIPTTSSASSDGAVQVKRGVGRPRKYPVADGLSAGHHHHPHTTPTNPTKKKKKQERAHSPPPTTYPVTSSRRRSGSVSTIKWGWGGKAVIQHTATGDKR